MLLCSLLLHLLLLHLHLLHLHLLLLLQVLLLLLLLLCGCSRPHRVRRRSRRCAVRLQPDRLVVVVIRLQLLLLLCPRGPRARQSAAAGCCLLVAPLCALPPGLCSAQERDLDLLVRQAERGCSLRARPLVHRRAGGPPAQAQPRHRGACRQEGCELHLCCVCELSTRSAEPQAHTPMAHLGMVLWEEAGAMPLGFSAEADRAASSARRLSLSGRSATISGDILCRSGSKGAVRALSQR